MTLPLSHPSPMTLEDYFSYEDRSNARHEYVEGFVYAMTGATKRHNRIVGRIYARLLAAEQGSGCRTYMEAVKLRLRDRIYYPDVMVACGPSSPDRYTEDAPSILVEVLSESTWQIDRREKLAAYHGIASLQSYLIVAQDERYVLRHWRDAEGTWQYDVLAGAGTIELPTMRTMLTLDEIYEGVEISPPEQRLRIRELEQAYG